VLRIFTGRPGEERIFCLIDVRVNSGVLFYFIIPSL